MSASTATMASAPPMNVMVHAPDRIAPLAPWFTLAVVLASFGILIGSIHACFELSCMMVATSLFVLFILALRVWFVYWKEIGLFDKISTSLLVLALMAIMVWAIMIIVGAI